MPKSNYAVMRLIESKGANALFIENGDGIIGYIPVYKNKAKAVKNAKDKYQILEIAEK